MSIKKYFYYIILLASPVCIGQTVTIDPDGDFTTDNPSNFFECKMADNLFEEGVAEIQVLDTEIIYIKNESNTGTYGTHISFKIDKTKTVCGVDYYTWDDLEDGSTTEFRIEEFKITLNKDPFEDGIENLQGTYTLKIRSEYDPGEILSRENNKPKTDIFTFKGVFLCKAE